MAKIKRRLKRRHKMRCTRPDVVSSCEPEGLVVFVYYDGKIGLTGIPDVTISSDDLPLLDRGIKEAFALLPWRTLDDLLKIADCVLDKGLSPGETTLIERAKALIVKLCPGKSPYRSGLSGS